MKSIFHSIVIKGKQSNFEMNSPWIRLHELSEMKNIASGGTSLVVHWLRLGTFTDVVRGSILGSVPFSRSVVSDSLRPHESQHARPPCPSKSPRVHSDSRPASP